VHYSFTLVDPDDDLMLFVVGLCSKSQETTGQMPHDSAEVALRERKLGYPQRTTNHGGEFKERRPFGERSAFLQ
jgi:hypothetical protein